MNRSFPRSCFAFGLVALAVALPTHFATATFAADEPLPFHYKVETYRDKAGDVSVFALRLEQPFLAEEFERSNYLRLQPQSANAYLIYPKETKFQQKHAEFYGRLKGTGTAKVRLSYEIVSENADGSRKVDVRSGDVEIPIPTEPGGPRSIFENWAAQQSARFIDLTRNYPDESFFQYVLLQSPQRYGVKLPTWTWPVNPADNLQGDLFGLTSTALSVQTSLQYECLLSTGQLEDYTILINDVRKPVLRSPPYQKMLADREAKQKLTPVVPDSAKLVPADQYFLQFASMRAVNDVMDLVVEWGENWQRIASAQALDHRVAEKLEEQLGLKRSELAELSDAGVISEVVITGADPFILEGSDVTLILKVAQADKFKAANEKFVADLKQRHKDLTEREFNYRGHQVVARYTDDRMVSSFAVRHGDYAVISNSHRAIRAIVDAATGAVPPLSDALDFQYATTQLTPIADKSAGYWFVSEANLARLMGPAEKISEKRRLQCFNNLVMLNNAALFYRMEYGKSPNTLNDLIEGRFVDPKKVVCPHGGAYAFDGRTGTCTCSLHNRLRYLTPNAELTVLKVAPIEVQQYDHYRGEFERSWQPWFGPLAARITTGPKVKIETYSPPFANGKEFQTWRHSFSDKPVPLDPARFAASAVWSCSASPGRKSIGDSLKQLPGVREALDADPTLADLTWLGDRAALHLCDATGGIELDPTVLHALNLPLLGNTPIETQVLAAALVRSVALPAYLTVDIEDSEKAARLLELLASRIYLEGGDVLGQTAKLDAYRLPDYKQHKMYVLTGQWYALKLRLHVALVNKQLVAATQPEILQQVIDAAGNALQKDPPQGQLLFRWNRRAMQQSRADWQLFWEEKSREACHRNAISIFNLSKLYDVPVDQTPKLSETEYGVRYYCPEHGVYEYDAARDQVLCTIHGNRQNSRQNPAAGRSSFQEFLERWEEATALLRLPDDGLFTTIELTRGAKTP